MPAPTGGWPPPPGGHGPGPRAAAAWSPPAPRRIEAMVVLADGAALCTPCGGCRQRIREFAEPAILIHLCGLDGVRRTLTVGEVLPLSFGPGKLRRQA